MTYPVITLMVLRIKIYHKEVLIYVKLFNSTVLPQDVEFMSSIFKQVNSQDMFYRSLVNYLQTNICFV